MRPPSIALLEVIQLSVEPDHLEDGAAVEGVLRRVILHAGAPRRDVPRVRRVDVVHLLGAVPLDVVDGLLARGRRGVAPLGVQQHVQLGVRNVAPVVRLPGVVEVVEIAVDFGEERRGAPSSPRRTCRGTNPGCSCRTPRSRSAAPRRWPSRSTRAARGPLRTRVRTRASSCTSSSTRSNGPPRPGASWRARDCTRATWPPRRDPSLGASTRASALAPGRGPRSPGPRGTAAPTSSDRSPD